MFDNLPPRRSVDRSGGPGGPALPTQGARRTFLEIVSDERPFLVLLMFGVLLVGATYDQPGIARWVGFLFASYAAVANDSIQTIGTFLASNRSKPWWALWLFIGGIFLATVGLSWSTHGGDVSFGRLQAKGFEQAPSQFAFLQVAAPLFLIVLTRLRMPVSTTFLLLASFADRSGGVTSMLVKSLTGYALSFGLALALWLPLGRMMARAFSRPPRPGWTLAQWITSGVLWSVWVQQDAANLVVYLPRSLSPLEFSAMAGVVFVGLGVLFRTGGERIQRVVDEKSGVVDVRAATVIDLLYAGILLVFQLWNRVPMSTTWVFLGLLAGRELSLTALGLGEGGRGTAEALRLVLRDAAFAFLGLLLSLVIACATNEVVREAVLGSIGLGTRG